MKEKDAYTVLANYPIGPAICLSRYSSGLINTSYHVEAATGTYVLQALGKVFYETTIHDREQVTAHLRGKGMVAQQIVHTSDGAAFHADAEGRIWCLMTFIEGTTYDSLPDDSYAAEAGAVLAKFHAAIEDFDASQLKSAPLVHQTKKFYEDFHSVYERLMREESNANEREHYHFIHEQLPSLMLPDGLPKSIIHGDAKISNIVFNGTAGICIIDLDTCMKQTPLFDLGDALRWCAISEEAFPNSVSLPRFKYTIQGYTSVQPLSAEIRSYIPQSFALVTLTLAARFAADIVHDAYFGWNSATYPSRKDHNRARAKSMVSLTKDILGKTEEMKKILAQKP